MDYLGITAVCAALHWLLLVSPWARLARTLVACILVVAVAVTLAEIDARVPRFEMSHPHFGALVWAMFTAFMLGASLALQVVTIILSRVIRS